MSRSRDGEATAAIEAAAADWIVRRDAGLSEEERGTYAKWLASDSRHAAAVARLEQAWTLLDRPRMGGRAGEMAGVLQWRAVARRRRRTGVAVAALFVVVSLGVVWQARHPVGTGRSPATAIVLTPLRQTLADGTVVELKPGAEVVADFAGPLRRVALRRGEALFHVAKDLQRPFVVTAAGVEVRAVGTVFAVHLGGAGVEVVVTEGRVAVEKPLPAPETGGASTAIPPAPNFSTLVDAGKRISVDLIPGATAPQAVAISPEEIAERLAWRATRIEFSDTPLAEAVELMNRHSRVRLIVDDPKLASVPVNGLFRADNTDTLVRLLEAGFGVSAERSGDTITLRRKR